MSLAESVYTAALLTGAAAAKVLLRGEGKVSRGVRGMRGSPARLLAWAEANRDPARPLAWFHAPSVGEGLQARAVMEALRSSDPDLQLLYTFFSPSAEPFARTAPADFSDYLPIDLPRVMRSVLEALRPGVVVFSKTEVWPNLTREAARQGIPCALLSATLPAGSSRLRGAARLLLRPAHSRLARVGAIAPADAERYAVLGVPAGRVFVMGDARYDQVARRAASVDRSSRLLSRLKGAGLTLVAGSTWPADESRLLPALAAILTETPGLRLIIAPHEPTPAALSRLTAELESHGFEHERLSRLEGTSEPPPRVVMVDRVGVLGELYALADIAYVGGGFGAAGLHSVLEPAAFGVPVLFGPAHANAREAAELIHRGGAKAAADAVDLESLLRRWTDDEAARVKAGSAARALVEENVGAARRGAEAVLDLLRD